MTDERNDPGDERSDPSAERSAAELPGRVAWLALGAILLVAATLRYRLLPVPLERDEGHYAYVAQLMLAGIPPYEQAYMYFLPGIYAAYAAILAVFGETSSGVHAGLLVVNAASTVVLFAIARRLFGGIAAVSAALAFAILSLGATTLGFTANAEHFVILPALGGLALILDAAESRRWTSLLGGAFLLGIGFIVKQHGAFFAAFGALYWLGCELGRRPLRTGPLLWRGAAFGFAGILPYALTCLALWWAGVFGTFWFWTVDFGLNYAGRLPLDQAWPKFSASLADVTRPAPWLWGLAVAGLFLAPATLAARRHRRFAAGFLLASFVAICPGLYFRPHYFLLLLPAVSLWIGIAAAALPTLLRWRIGSPALRGAIALLLVAGAAGSSVFSQKRYFFRLSPDVISRRTYGINPFIESPRIADYIRSHSDAGDQVAILGSEPQILFYAGRRSPTGYITTINMIEPGDLARRMQDEMIGEIESAAPRFLVVVNTFPSWSITHLSDQRLADWFEAYRQRHYERVGLIEIDRPHPSQFVWDGDPERPPKSGMWIAVFERTR